MPRAPGRPADVGVIGMAVFKERVVQPEVSEREAPMLDRPNRGYADGADSVAEPAPAPPPAGIMAPSSRAAPQQPSDKAAAGALARRDERLGTAHGAREWSVVTTVAFERATSYPQSIRQIEYDTYTHLVANGVIPAAPPYRPRGPRPFPANPDGGGYVPDPPADPWEPGL